MPKTGRPKEKNSIKQDDRVTVQVSKETRNRLQEQANGKPLGRYIKDLVDGAEAAQEMIAKILAVLVELHQDESSRPLKLTPDIQRWLDSQKQAVAMKAENAVQAPLEGVL